MEEVPAQFINNLAMTTCPSALQGGLFSENIVGGQPLSPEEISQRNSPDFHTASPSKQSTQSSKDRDCQRTTSLKYGLDILDPVKKVFVTIGTKNSKCLISSSCVRFPSVHTK